MTHIEKSPTPHTYEQFQLAYDWFNARLFNDELPNCLITLQRKSNAMGYFSPARWANAQGDKTDEIALNPAYFANHSLKELLQTLVHEMCHQWQEHFGTPSRGGYHNTQWAQKMESIGLMPSSTGEPGGKKTGQHMGDYAIAGGAFEIQALHLVKQNFNLPWVDRVVAFNPSSQDRQRNSENETDLAVAQLLDQLISQLLPELDIIQQDHPQRETQKQKRKTTYECPTCHAKVWGKPDLALLCLACDSIYEAVS